jgi:hypothetical protein
MESGKFFHAGPVEGLILDCYRLAKYYHINPEEFLKLPMSQIARHLSWTAKLIEETSEPHNDD